MLYTYLSVRGDVAVCFTGVWDHDSTAETQERVVCHLMNLIGLYGV